MPLLKDDCFNIASQAERKEKLLLKDCKIDIFLFDFRCFDSDYFISLLSEDEILKARKFKFQTDNDKSIISRGILRILLSSYIDIPPSEIEFHYNKNKKPYVELSQNRDATQFNISHSGDYLLIGISNKEIGVDIEIKKTVDDIDDIDEIVKRYAKNGENHAIRNCEHPDMKLDLFFLWWTKTEALLKAKGVGITKISTENTNDYHFLESFKTEKYIYSICLI